ERWGLLLTEVVGAAARDLAEAAGEHAADAGDDVRNEVVLAAVLIVASAAVGLATAATLTRPARDLQSAARRVEAGDFESDPVPVRGPMELRETVLAFNDMAATLAAVEDHAVALAEDPTSTVLDDPLPGRTGLALQQAIDRLRTSVHQAETHRAELLELATHDGLTGLLNRAAAFTAIQHDLSRADRDGTQLLALYVDLDGLKLLNDTYGHDVGDEAIARTADALRSTTRDSDVVARLGGDEFMVVGPVPEGGRDEIAAFAERIRAAVSLQTVRVGAGEAAPLRCSIGVALSDEWTGSAEALVRAADEAMYAAKHAGRDRIAWTDTAPDQRDGTPH
ncbi:MAG TPA: GGDEF domain-containing protein, partial [Acidimicrobiales bacterium]|nr:GGDEF domain-containing protein [Acidimicrobiales bacterium]